MLPLFCILVILFPQPSCQGEPETVTRTRQRPLLPLVGSHGDSPSLERL